MSTLNRPVKLIAFYLPQFHPIPENDKWWGKGFTEWKSVVKAKPLFKGHYQPHIPADLGFYDLRLPEIREAQAEMAKSYGIYGFCYYHYWFNGKRVLERPFEEVLKSGRPNFPFCLCWANENWTRIWDGGQDQVLLHQDYNFDDDLAHIESIIPAFKDRRYIKVDGKPLFLVYRTELLPDPARTAEIWRKAAVEAGIGDLFLARVEGFTDQINPYDIGFDAAVEFAPDWRNRGEMKYRRRRHRLLAKVGLIPKVYINNKITDYQEMIEKMLDKPEPNFLRYRCVTPIWDNSPRRKMKASIFFESTPEKYEKWLSDVIIKTYRNNKKNQRIVFINAWNEWGEGNHLEPDEKWGRAYLEATYRAINGNFAQHIDSNQIL